MDQAVPDVRARLHRLPGLEPSTRTRPVNSDSRRAVTRALRIGVIASEFPPDLGGMQEHARGLVVNLAADHAVSVYTSGGKGRDAAGLHALGRNVTVHPVMRWSEVEDLRVLDRAPVDAWLTLNAGLACYSLGLSAPVFAYIYGNDFTRPWLPHPGRPVRLAGRLLGEQVVAQWRAGRISAGLRGARWVFSISEFSRRLCAEVHGVAGSRMSIVPPGIGPEFFRGGSPADSPRLRLVTVSRLTAAAARKNIDGVIKAVALLKGEIGISYTVIGEGDDLPRLRSLAAGLGVAADVQFLGAVSTERIVDEFGRNDAFIMAVKPSGGDVEGFGMVFAEAAATGLPSIGANIGGIPEVIEHGVTGLLLDDVSEAGIAEGLKRFHRRRHAFDRAALRTRAEQFSAFNCSATIARTIAAKI